MHAQVGRVKGSPYLNRLNCCCCPCSCGSMTSGARASCPRAGQSRSPLGNTRMAMLPQQHGGRSVHRDCKLSCAPCRNVLQLRKGACDSRWPLSPGIWELGSIHDGCDHLAVHSASCTVEWRSMLMCSHRPQMSFAGSPTSEAGATATALVLIRRSPVRPAICAMAPYLLSPYWFGQHKLEHQPTYMSLCTLELCCDAGDASHRLHGSVDVRASYVSCKFHGRPFDLAVHDVDPSEAKSCTATPCLPTSS
jgi:hypothetical protein